MNQTLVYINNHREDISNYLFHFTKGDNALGKLQKILSEDALRDTKGNGYLCFTETPIYMLGDFFEYVCKKYTTPTLLAPYGIGIKKDLLFKNGARPVIYGISEEKDLLPKELQWRHVDLNLPDYDFSWMREWRYPLKDGKVGVRLPQNDVIVVTRYADEQILFYDMEIDNPDWYEQIDDSMVDFKQKYVGIAFEDIKKYNTKQKLEEFFQQQIKDMDEQL